MQSAAARSAQQTMAVANVWMEEEVERVGIRAPICLTIFPFLRFSALALNGKIEKRNKSNEKSTENYSSESCSCGGYRHQYARQTRQKLSHHKVELDSVSCVHRFFGRRMRAHTLNTDIFQPKSPPALFRVCVSAAAVHLFCIHHGRSRYHLRRVLRQSRRWKTQQKQQTTISLATAVPAPSRLFDNDFFRIELNQKS